MEESSKIPIEESSYDGLALPEELNSEEPQALSEPGPRSEEPAPSARQVIRGNSSGDWRLVIANRKYPLGGNYQLEIGYLPADYVTKESARAVDIRIVDALVQMLDASRASGVSLLVTSSYRSVEYQTVLFSSKTQEYLNMGYSQAEAEAAAEQIVARPGTSEHNTGLAVDLVDGDNPSSWGLYQSFDQTPEFAWLDARAADYGFILRYPQDKTDITGISYEPWHYRYVGVEYAKAIKAAGVCLEEYLGLY
jgi:D-alanyl-D-alanine carboxypeptidase